MRHNLTYQQASKNSSYRAGVAEQKAIEAGKSAEEAREIYRMAYEAEMRWYES